MAGHSKWHNIKIRKGKQDAVRGNLFTKLAREIIVAAKAGGGNPDANLRLKLAVQKAKENSMPADNIKRAIQRGTGEIDGASYDEVIYEGYGPAGVAMLIKTLTDNRNRTVAELRVVFSRNGGNMGESGCVSWMFDSKGVITIDGSATDEETLMMTALDAGAEDIKTEGGAFEVLTAPADLDTVRTAIEAARIKYDSAEVSMLPQTTVEVRGKEVTQVLRMMDQFDDLDDVQQVYANFDIPDDEMEAAEV